MSSSGVAGATGVAEAAGAIVVSDGVTIAAEVGAVTVVEAVEISGATNDVAISTTDEEIGVVIAAAEGVEVSTGGPVVLLEEVTASEDLIS